MRKSQILNWLFAVMLLPALLVPSRAQSTAADPQTRGDNTKVNQRDKNTAEPTADQQKDNRSDRELTKQIRKSLVKDESLSTYAHNIKVIAQDGKVTLKGPVRSEEEKAAVLSKAAQVAGQGNITDEVTIVPKNQ